MVTSLLCWRLPPLLGSNGGDPDADAAGGGTVLLVGTRQEALPETLRTREATKPTAAPPPPPPPLDGYGSTRMLCV